MATYYWLGTVSSDLNDNRNWTLWAPGGTYPPYAPTKPVWNSTIVFADYPIQGLSFTFPLNSPSGTLSGNTLSPGNTSGIRTVGSVTIKGNLKKSVGTSAAPLIIGAGAYLIQHSAGGYTSAYIHGLAGSSGDVPIYISSQDPNVSYYITGNGSVYLTNTSYPTYSDIYLYNFTGTVGGYSAVSYDRIWMNSTTSITQTTFVGNNTINIDKGFSVQNDEYLILEPATANTSMTLNLLPVGISGSSGPVEYTQSTLRLYVSGADSNYPLVNVNHGTDFVALEMQGGHINFAPAGPNDGCRIFEGYMNTSTSKMTIADVADVSLLDPFSSYHGFILHNSNSSNSAQQIPIYTTGNARISLLASDQFWNGVP